MVIEDSSHRIAEWLAALDERHLADLTPAEVARALRALSSCYVERRGRLSEGAALATAGKRAAFALFYAPVHLLLAQHIVRALTIPTGTVKEILDLGCGTGSAGAAWALEAGSIPVFGADRHPWAVAEANWTYRQLAINGRAIRQDVSRFRMPIRPGAGIVAAYTINELSHAVRDALLTRLLQARSAGASLLIIEPIARSVTPWWSSWDGAFKTCGGRTDEWRVPVSLPKRQRDLARSAGLRPQELTARSLFVQGAGS
jgi:SAM-dependent methyltransferase